MARDRYVELERHPLGGFGFSVIGGVDTHLPPMVCALVHNGSAHLSGKVSLSLRHVHFDLQPFSRPRITTELQYLLVLDYFQLSFHSMNDFFC